MCEGAGAAFANCMKVQMDDARECRTRVRTDGNGYYARCAEHRL